MNEQSVELVWKDPPPLARPTWGSRYEKAAERLRQRPGQWARVHRYATLNSASASASKINNRGTSSFPKGQFEAAARGLELYVRYVGTPEQQT